MAVLKTLRSGLLTQGEEIPLFEKEFGAFVNSSECVAVSSGTGALHLMMLAQGVRPGQTVLTTPMTFAATSNSVLYCGGTVDFVDIDPATGLMDLNKLESRLRRKSSSETIVGLVMVHFAGQSANMEALASLADRFGLWVMEDGCHAPGAYFLNSANEKVEVGSCKYSLATAFSFHPVKHIAAGEGGMVATGDHAFASKVRQLRTHGITRDETSFMFDRDGSWYYEMQSLGFNYRMSDLHASLARSQLRRIDHNLASRRRIAARYSDAFNGTEVKCLMPGQNLESHAFHLFVVLVENRKKVFEFLRGNGIAPQVHYVPVHLHPYYRSLGFAPGDFPAAESYYSRALSIPIYPGLSDSEQDSVIHCILEATGS